MTFSIFTLVILVLLKETSDAAVDTTVCAEKSHKYEGEVIEGAGDKLDKEGDWEDSHRQDRGIEECKELCRIEPNAKGWSLRYFQNQQCICFRTITKSQPDSEYKSNKFCECDLKYHSRIQHSSSFSKPAFCQSADGGDVASTSPLPHGATCNLTCTGSYVGTPGVLECRARDWKVAGPRIIMTPKPNCRLNSTAVLYASVGGGLAVALILFILLVCCLRQKQSRAKRRAEKDRQRVTMREAREGGGGGAGEDAVDGIDRRKSYKKATGHLSMDEESREADFMINELQEGLEARYGRQAGVEDGIVGRQDDIVYANVGLKDHRSNPHRQGRNDGPPITMIGAPDIEAIYLEGSLANENDRNQYIVVDKNHS